ncbi:MAG: OpgC domain-containing protein [Pseudomonadota bacterium]
MPNQIAAKAPRDLRLDFFRGIAMMIILIVHTPGNKWSWYVPAAFGHSAANEMFIFISGFASALAFGVIFTRHAWWIGAARVYQRMWEVYWAHIGLFLVVAVMVVVGANMTGIDYVGKLNLWHFFNDTPTNLVGLFTLTYVPNLFDILPIYLVMLAMLPFVVAAYRIHLGWAFALVLAVYLLAWGHLVPGANMVAGAAGFQFPVNLPAEPFSAREWFFNPFGWQLCFFMGFFFGMKWIHPPAWNQRWLIIACIVIVIVSYFLKRARHWELEILLDPAVRDIFFPEGQRSALYWMRMVHFFALAYLVLSFLEHRKHWLEHWVFRPFVIVGQASLPAFLASIAFGRVMGMALDQTELLSAPEGVDPAVWVNETSRSDFWLAVVNISGMIALVLFCRMMVFFKRKPWTKRGDKGAAMDKAQEDAALANADRAPNEAVMPAEASGSPKPPRPAGAPAE